MAARSTTSLIPFGLTVIALCIALSPSHVDAHGYMSKPLSRNKLANNRPEPGPVNYCPHCLNLGGRRTTPLVYPETIESGLSHGLCGDKPLGSVEACWGGGDCPEQDHMPGGRFYTPGAPGLGGAIQETYVEGDTIDVEFVITAHHRGFIELRLCDEKPLTQACLNKYPALERVRYEDDYRYSAQPIDPEAPQKYFLNPVCAYPQDGAVGGYRMEAKFKLPEGVTCETCVIQMWWITANSCVPPGYRDFNFPTDWDTCGGDGGAGWYTSGQADCEGSTQAEEFWNCADVKILPGAPTPSIAPTPQGPTPSPTTAAPTPAPTTPAPTTTCEEVAVWGQCGGQGDWSGKCCEPGSWCSVGNPWYSQCVPGQAPAPATPGPTMSPTLALTPAPTPPPTTAA
eukprot:CAMPEP_0117670744 /NCGR_PEP_ID=MMETSP0804-20121206/12942_1 /TAXON_ID=1074897 /ORGANISM="Tetraselmis astigmatica, Strain CCMP880" /LENGTH=397 /DNA_ID=CAMNT_0005479115 /DNA_START=102 /DNA_END=1292 /DNA_ORIENTATION=-